MITLYFIFYALQAALLAVYLALVGSEPGASVVFNLSLSRLLLVAAVFAASMIFAWLAYRSRRADSRIHRRAEALLDHEKKIGLIFLGGVFLAAVLYFLLTRQTNWFGDLKLVYERLEPVLVWLALLGIQSAFLAAVWYCAHFMRQGDQSGVSQDLAELPALFGVYLLFILVKLVLVTSTSYGPLGRGDEMTYFDMAESFYRGFFSVAQSHHYPPLYPLAIMPALVFREFIFEGIKFINVVLSSSIIFPAYFIARQFLNRKHSLIAVLLTCLIPYHLVYPRRILSENLYFPLFIWAVYITLTAPRNRRMRLQWDMLNGVMLAVLYLTRYISLAAIPFFMLAWWIKPFEGEGSLFRPGWKKIRHAALLTLAMLAAYSPWLIAGLAEGVELKLILGFGVAAKTDPAALTLPRLLLWALLYVCYYILVSAPVLNLLLATVTQIDLRRWREGLGRLVFEMLALMAGFYVAVTRHSWRAYYNREMPSKIMGRYLIVFSVLYILIAMIVMRHFDRKRVKSKAKFIIWTGIFPFLLIVLANAVLIQGAIFPVDEYFMKALGSVDGFLTEILGPYFFLMVALLYGVEIFLLLTEKRKYLLPVFVAGMAVYYLSGYPAYYRSLMDYQTYPWLSGQIADLLPESNLKDQSGGKISVFLPAEHTSQDEAEIYNGLRVRGIDNTEILTDGVDPLGSMTNPRGFIIRQLKSADEAGEGLKVYAFNGQYFTIREVDHEALSEGG